MGRTLSEITSVELAALAVFREKVLRNVALNRTIGRPRSKDGKPRKIARPNRTDEQEEADFWARVDLRSCDECWPWLGLTHPVNPYGQVRFKRKFGCAHPVAFSLFHGFRGVGFVCPKCDNFSCCNPLHLYLGTPKQNTEDAVSRGRMARGSRHGCSKLSDLQIREIRADPDWSSPGWLDRTARKLGVSKPLVSLIRRRLIWKHI